MKLRKMRSTLFGVLATVLVLLILLLGQPAAAAVEAAEGKSPGSNLISAQQQLAQGPTDPAELEAFLDQLMARDMEEHHIAGAAVSVVKDGKLFFAKGYGYANLEKGIPVDPEETIFRIGSVGKTFTWTAVMQLVEQGKLDLDADINTYLDFRMPDTYPQPITLKHLLTHTSGLENRLLGSGVSDAKDVVPAREFLVANMAPRLRPPGEYVNYSNFNAMLAGYIVVQVSGQPYDQYIQEHILDPLGMEHSTVQLETPPDLLPHASVGYIYAGGTFKALPEFTLSPAGLPSGMHQASVKDMARFMIAHLHDGSYSDDNVPEAHILEESTMQQMHSALFTPDPHLSGTAHGLFDWSYNGQQAIGHRGYYPPMHSQLLLLPDRDLGVFVIYNSDGGGSLANQHSGFQKAFFDHYFPASGVEPIQPPEGFAERAGRFVGDYRSTESSGTAIVKVVGLFDTTKISDPGDGTLLLATWLGEFRYVEVEPLYFRQVDGPFGIAFREDGQGRITYLFSDHMPNVAFEKLEWYETRGFHMALALGSLLIFLSTIPAAVIRLIRNRRLGVDRKLATRGAGVAHGIILGSSILNLLFVAGIALGVPGLMQNVLLDPPGIMKIALGLGVLSAVMTAGALVYMVLAWKNSYWGIAGRAYYTLVTIAAVTFVWFLDYWNLLGWRY